MSSANTNFNGSIFKELSEVCWVRLLPYSHNIDVWLLLNYTSILPPTLRMVSSFVLHPLEQFFLFLVMVLFLKQTTLQDAPPQRPSNHLVPSEWRRHICAEVLARLFSSFSCLWQWGWNGSSRVDVRFHEQFIYIIVCHEQSVKAQSITLQAGAAPQVCLPPVLCTGSTSIHLP